MRSTRFAIVAAIAGASFGAPGAGFAQGGAAPAPWHEAIRVNGFLGTSYSYNFNRPDSQTNTLRVFDFDDQSFKLDDFELVAQRPASKPRESGFRADIVFGSSVPRVSAASGLFRDDAGTAGDLDLQQAYATYVAPLGSGLRFLHRQRAVDRTRNVLTHDHGHLRAVRGQVARALTEKQERSHQSLARDERHAGARMHNVADPQQPAAELAARVKQLKIGGIVDVDIGARAPGESLDRAAENVDDAGIMIFTGIDMFF